MRPRPLNEGDFAYWAAQNPRAVTYTGPGEIEAGIEPCPAMLTDGDEFGPVVRVPVVLDEIELAHLAKGGTIWLSTWGGLPVFMLEVEEPRRG